MSTNPRPPQVPFQSLAGYWCVSVRLHTDGSVWASVGKMNLENRRLRWVGLVPREWWGDPHAAGVQALFEAATEVALAQGEGLRLL